jgi:hypothetical protein
MTDRIARLLKEQEMAKRQPKKAKLHAFTAPQGLAMPWGQLFKTWVAWAASGLATISGAYASSDALQQMVTPAQFASFTSIAGLVILVLRNISQTEAK